MKRTLLFFPMFLILISTISYAEESVPKPMKKTDFYLLGSFGAGVGDTKSLSGNDTTSITSFGAGITAGYQITRLFAVELGYSRSLIGKDEFRVGDIYQYKYQLYQDDYKANFLVQYHLGYRFLGFIPYAGAGIMLSYKNYNFATGSLADIKNEFDFGLSFKAGVRAKLAVVMIGAFVEYDLRFITTKNLVGGVEVGLAY